MTHSVWVEFDAEEQMGRDGKPYMTLAYTNGPGYFNHRTANGSLSSEQPRRNISSIDGEEMGWWRIIVVKQITQSQQTNII